VAPAARTGRRRNTSGALRMEASRAMANTEISGAAITPVGLMPRTAIGGDTEEKKVNLPGEAGVWVLITGDMFTFMLYFVAFASERLAHPVVFEQGRRQLDASLGLANTFILLTSSWLVVRAVNAARAELREKVRRNLAGAMLLGLTFVVLKVYGYVHDISAGHSITTNEFFGYYFAITGIHFLHVLVGLTVLWICFRKAARHDDARLLVWIESGGCFWHMVDMLWVLLFPMFYLLRGP
jgi:nitric oxide reductase NorE protein